MNKFFKYNAAVALSMLMLASCAEDKGNYEYSDKEIITISGIPEQISVLANAENIVITPTITSNLRGEIGNNHSDFEFSCQRKEDNKWVEMCSDPQIKDINMLADISAKQHTCRYVVTDKATGVRTSFLFYINATTTTSEGWILLCNEESTNKVRVDMLSHISMNRIVPAYNVVKFSEEVPTLQGPRSLVFTASWRAWGNKIIMSTETGSYLIPSEGNQYGFGAIQTVTGAQELKMSLFLSTPTDHIVKCVNIPCNNLMSHSAVLAISKEGNAFAWDHTVAGSGFEYPINTSTRGGDVEYKVAPFVGVSRDRYWSQKAYGIALMYDIDNKRFIAWDSENDNGGSVRQRCYPMANPANQLFDVTNTGMELVSIVNTLSNALCIMQDGSKRHIYNINVLDKNFNHDGYYEDIQAEHFNDATIFEASCQYPVIYYGYQNKVYSYNYATGENKVAVELPAEEEVTLLKFNRYDDPYAGVYDLIKDPVEKAEFTARENELIVASYNSTATEDNGGSLRFYKTTSPGVDLTLKEGWEYSGFAKIVDLVYKEVRR